MRVPVSALFRVEASANSLCAHTEVLQHIFQNAVLLHIELQGMNLDGHMSITEMVTAPREGVPVIALSLYKRFGLRVDQVLWFQHKDRVIHVSDPERVLGIYLSKPETQESLPQRPSLLLFDQCLTQLLRLRLGL